MNQAVNKLVTIIQNCLESLQKGGFYRGPSMYFFFLIYLIYKDFQVFENI